MTLLSAGETNRNATDKDDDDEPVDCLSHSLDKF